MEEVHEQVLNAINSSDAMVIIMAPFSPIGESKWLEVIDRILIQCKYHRFYSLQLDQSHCAEEAQLSAANLWRYFIDFLNKMLSTVKSELLISYWWKKSEINEIFFLSEEILKLVKPHSYYVHSAFFKLNYLCPILLQVSILLRLHSALR